ncbi:hypothetical protein ACU3L3_13830 [Priestia endophytica]|uniref:Uncharacterized protein n=1 Tax=Priestia endophytica DSM 13796 TaxID=1121089 RepID=A0A1I6BUZ1_9BACI|nr:hypothetical protein [Priestia endophytica]KYG30801.1 hypothetical protein AZF06_23735 [Priestia endophytica]MBG9811107.1 hypothetical protein [Priestia endophytica]SFQ84768.1 hypothetical protein SAMN02745910_04276 [Priestia endophytica DSM 13796]
MKKTISILTALSIGFGLLTFTDKGVSATEKEISNLNEEQEPIDKLNTELKKEGKEPITEEHYFELANEALDKARIEVNKQLEEGKEDIKVEEEIGDEDLFGTVTFETEILQPEPAPKNLLMQSDGYNTLAYQNKNYSHSIAMNGFAYQFRMKTFGSFTHGKNSKGQAVVNGYSYQCDAQTIWPYSASDTVRANRVDPSYVKVISKGTFTALKVGATYHGYIDIGLYGSGNYRVLRSKFDY